MNLKIETDLVSVTTHFTALGNPPWGNCQIVPSSCVSCSDAAVSRRDLPVLPGDEASQDGGPSHSRDPADMAQARVDIRKLQQFLMGQQVNPSKAMCSKSS